MAYCMILLLRALRFYSRLPLPVLPWEQNPHAPPDFRILPFALPWAGALLGLMGALFLSAGMKLGLGPILSATFCIGIMTLITGAFHEDGLADMADGFGGGSTIERRLEIMKDSRIGSFGVSALIISYALRIGALSLLVERIGGEAAALAFIGISSLSRCLGLVPLTFLEPARIAGFSAEVGRPSLQVTGGVIITSFLLTIVLLLWSGLGISQALAALAAALVPTAYITHMSHRLIAGQTGDVAGAVQQMAEAFGLIGMIISLSVAF
jgi:adenosylcobinamide-GDP ribazoletransferase